jgi:putative transcriptional regulator
VELIATRTYERAVRKLLPLEQREAMEAAICADPLRAPVIPGSGGIRKLRWMAPGRGKRGGVRTIYFFTCGRLVDRLRQGRTRGSEAGRLASVGASRSGDQEGSSKMTEGRSVLGREVEEALNEVLAHVRGEAALATRVVDDPSKARIMAVRKRLGLSRRQFAERYHLDPRTVQDWEQGRRTPDQAARVLLTVIEREPEAVERALTKAE